MGVSPGAQLSRFQGVGQSLLKTPLAALQWGQSALGYKPTPTPPFLEPTDTEQQIGQQIGQLGQLSMLPAKGPAMLGNIPKVGRALQTGAASLAGGLGGSLVSAAHGENPYLAGILGAAAPLAARVDIPTKAKSQAIFQSFEPKIAENPVNVGSAKKAVATAQEIAK